MNKLLIGVLGLFLAFSLPEASSQEPPTQQLQTDIAAVATYTGSIVEICIKPQKGDDRPGSRFLLVPADGTDSIVVLLPGKSRVQDEIIAQTLDACIQQGVVATFSGDLVTHTNSFGARTSLIIRRLELDMPEQTLIIVWK